MYISRIACISAIISSACSFSVTYDKLYSNSSFPVDQLACSKNGIIKEGYNWRTLGDIVYAVTGFEGVDGPDSPLCFSCWVLEYHGTARAFLVLDGAESGFVSTLERVNSLTGGKAKELIRVDVKATQVPLLNCGISPEQVPEQVRNRELK